MSDQIEILYSTDDDANGQMSRWEPFGLLPLPLHYLLFSLSQANIDTQMQESK